MNKSQFNYSILLLLSLLFLFSCRTDPATTTDAATVTNGADATVNSRVRAEPTGLNPLMTYQAVDLQVLGQIFQPLLEYDPVDLKLKPMLAKSRPEIEYIKENEKTIGTRYMYEIREDATWSNGQPVLASDVLFTIKAYMNPAMKGATAAYRGIINAISKVEIDPENPRKFTTEVSPFNFRGESTTGTFFILPESVYDPKGLLKNISLADLLNPQIAKKLEQNEPNLQTLAADLNSPKYQREVLVGSGPYELQEWITDDRIILEKKKNWWGEAYNENNSLMDAYPKRIVYRPVPDAAPLVAMMQNGKVDIAGQIPNSVFVDLQNDPAITSAYHLYNPPSSITAYIGVNSNRPELKDKRVRKAIAYLVDTDEIIRTVKQGMATKIASPIPQDFDYYNKKLEPLSLNINKARALLKEAGWTDTDNDGIVDKVIDGKKTKMSLDYQISAGSEVSNDMAVIIKKAAKKAGVDIDVQPRDRNTILKKIRERDYDLFPSGFGRDMDHFDLHQQFHTENIPAGGGNRWGFGTPETDQMIDEIRNTTDDARRKELYLKMQEIIYDEVPMIFLYKTLDCVALNNRFKNITPSIKPPGYFENSFRLKK